MKIESNNTVDENIFYKAVVKQEKQNFLDIIKKQKVSQEKKFNVYTIAAKIARGETVSSEELLYIRENAPSLFEAAKQQNIERQKNERGENGISKGVKQKKSANQLKNNSDNTDENSTKTNGNLAEVDENKQDSVLLNKIIMG